VTTAVIEAMSDVLSYSPDSDGGADPNG